MRTKRILSILIALVMTLGLIPFSAFTAFADDTPEATEISVGETLTASVGKGETVYFTFTPDEDGNYLFYSSSENDTWCRLYDAEMNELTQDDDSGENTNFRIGYGMTSGTKYYYEVSLLDSNIEDSFGVTLETAPEAESVTLTMEEWNAYIGLYDAYILGAVLSPEGSFGAVSWTTSDESVATLEINGLDASVRPVAPGSAVITATLSNGESATCTFNVLEPADLTLDTPVDVEMINNQSKCFAFVPEETGDYLFYCSDFSDDKVPRIVVVGKDVHSYGETGEPVCVFLEKGERYLADTVYGSYSGDGNGAYKLSVTKAVPVTSFKIVSEEGYSDFPGSQMTLKAVFEPWNAKRSTVSWSSNDENVAEVYGGVVELKNVGKATITAASEDGFSDTCEITVNDWPEIKVGETLSTGEIRVDQTILFRFIPEKDGRYAFYSTSDHDPYCYVLDEYMNEIGFDDDFGEEMNFRLKASLEKGKTYYFKLGCYGSDPTAEFSVTLEESPSVSSVEIVTPPDRTEYVKGLADRYFSYEGLSLKIYWSDGEVSEWNSSEEPYVRDEDISCDISSIEDGTVIVLCGGAQTSFNVTLIENPVESIEVVTPSSKRFIENIDGYWDTVEDEETGEPDSYFHYYIYSDYFEDAQIKINYKNGTSKMVSFGSEVDGFGFSLRLDQSETHWKVGSENYLDVEYLGASARMSITVDPNPVDRLELVSAPTREYFFGDVEYGHLDPEDGYIFYPDDFTGLAVKVYMKNGETKIIEGITDKYGKYDGFEYIINYKPFDAQIGDFTVTFSYMGKTVDFTVKLKESPVNSIEITKLPGKTVIYPNFFPDWTGLEITVHNKNGSTEVITLDQSNSYFTEFRHNGYKGYIEYDGNENKYFVKYLGAECPVDGMTFAENKDVTDVSVKCFRPDSTSTLVYVTYSDGTEDVFDVDILNNKYETDHSAGCDVDVLTEKGWMFISFTKHPETEEYIFYALRRFFEISPLYGDVNDDGEVTALDIVRLKKYLAAYDFDKKFSDVAVSLGADVNGDGEITALDAVRLKRYFAEYDASTGKSSVTLGASDENEGWSPDIT